MTAKIQNFGREMAAKLSIFAAKFTFLTCRGTAKFGTIYRDKQMPLDYSNKNIDNFIKNMQQKTSFSLGISPLPDNPDFVKFNKTFKETIDIYFVSLKSQN